MACSRNKGLELLQWGEGSLDRNIFAFSQSSIYKAMSWVPALHQASASHGRETMNKTLIQHSGSFSTIKHTISSSQLWWVWVMSGDSLFQEWTFFRKHPFNKRGFNKGGIYLTSQLHPVSTQQVSHMTSYCPERNHCASKGPISAGDCSQPWQGISIFSLFSQLLVRGAVS